MNAKNVLVVGASSGIGLALTERLLRENHRVWGLARRVESLALLSAEPSAAGHFHYSPTDITDAGDIRRLADEMKQNGFVPDIVVLNAAVWEGDMADDLNLPSLQKMMDINFLGAMRMVDCLLPIMAKDGQFIAISSSSAFKGSTFEGAGYAASKAALSVAFESFHQRWGRQGPAFTTVFFGPIATLAKRLKHKTPFTLPKEKAVACIMAAMRGRKPVYYHPWILFLVLRLAKLLPPTWYLGLIHKLDLKTEQITPGR